MTMGDQDQSTGHPCVDYVRISSKLTSIKLETTEFKDLIIRSFVNGSRAEAEAVSHFLQNKISSGIHPTWLVNVLKVLPTAVPEKNVPPLVCLCTELAIQIGSETSLEPLLSFTYVEIQSRYIAVDVLFKVLQDQFIENSLHLRTCLTCLRPFWEQVLSEDTTGSNFYQIISGISQLSSFVEGDEKVFLAQYLLDLGSEDSNSGTSAMNSTNIKDESFLLSEVIRTCSDEGIWRRVVIRCVCHNFEHGSDEHFSRLWKFHQTSFKQVYATLDLELFILIISLRVAEAACSGDYRGGRIALRNIQMLLQFAKTAKHRISKPLYELITSIFLSVASICPAGIADYLTHHANQALHDARNLGPKEDITQHKQLNATLELFLAECVRLKYCKTILAFGLFAKLHAIWNSPMQLVKWFEIDLYNVANTQLLSNFTADDQTDGKAWMSGDISQTNQAEVQTTSSESLASEIIVSCIALTGESHPNSQVRIAAMKSMVALSSRVLLFQLPAMLNCLQHEKNGAIASHLVGTVFASKQLLTDEASRNVIFSLVLQLSHGTVNDQSNPVAETCFSVIAHAVTYCPGVASSILQSEVKNIISIPNEKSIAWVSAAAGAVHRLVSIRPARGAAFIPFISYCIQKERLINSSEAASLCLAAMEIMTGEEVLDPVKAVRVVLKTIPDPLKVPITARGSYLRLLGSVSAGSQTKKGRSLTEKIVNILKDCIISYYPISKQTSRGLKWCDVKEAATSLCRYSVDEILGLAFKEEECATDLAAEKERKEKEAEKKAELVQQFISTMVEAARQSETVKGLDSLVIKIIKYEWENRARLNFDPERIAKLKSKTEALRRARLAEKGETAKFENLEVGKGVESFKVAASALPTGVLKSLCNQCTSITTTKVENPSPTIASITLHLLARSKALPSGLPWAHFLREVYRNGVNSYEKAACIIVLRLLKDSTVELENLRRLWYSEGSPILVQGRDDPVQMTELLLGVALQSDVTDISDVIDSEFPLEGDVILGLANAAIELKDAEAALEKTAKYLYGQIVIQCHKWKPSVQAKLELSFHENCLQYCRQSFVDLLLDGYLLNEPGVRILSKLEQPQLLRKMCSVVTSKEFDGEGSKPSMSALAVADTLGQVLCKQNMNFRQDLLFDLSKNQGNDKSKLLQYHLVAYLLGVSALLPNVEAAVMAAKQICAPVNHQFIERLATSLNVKQ